MALTSAVEEKVLEIKQAIADENAQTTAALDALGAQVASLKAQVAAGLSPDEVIAVLDSLETGIKEIYEPPVEPPVE